MVLPLGFLEFFGLQGFLMLAILGVLLYGERLPEVAASLGKQLLRLKKSVDGIRNEIESTVRDTTHSVNRSIEHGHDSSYEEATAPKFEPPPVEPAEPVASGSAAELHESLGGPSADNS